MANHRELEELLNQIGSLDKSVDVCAILNDEDKVVIECQDEAVRDAIVDLVAKLREYLDENKDAVKEDSPIRVYPVFTTSGNPLGITWNALKQAR